ncbi:MAG: hypothetical protein Q9M92_02015 [Enterobacterales bacterium]|nr:hypothetical protein [Enterobacterales bacterium]
MQVFAVLYFFIGMIVAGLYGILYFRNLTSLMAKLEDKHPDIWVGLGKPSLGFNNKASSSFKLVSFVLKKSVTPYCDLEIAILKRKTRKYFLFYIFLLISSMSIIPIVSVFQ